MKIKLPDIIKVGGLDYKIKIGSAPVSVKLAQEHCIGEHEYLLQLISLLDYLPPQQFTLTFLHEILHAVNSSYCSDNKLTEGQVEGMSNGLLQVLQQLGVEFTKD